MKIYYEKDADLKDLHGKTIAVIGYGSQGQAQAMCMKDSGLNVIIGLYKESSNWGVAKKYGFEVLEVKEAASGEIVVVAGISDISIGETICNENTTGGFWRKNRSLWKYIRNTFSC